MIEVSIEPAIWLIFSSFGLYLGLYFFIDSHSGSWRNMSYVLRKNTPWLSAVLAVPLFFYGITDLSISLLNSLGYSAPLAQIVGSFVYSSSLQIGVYFSNIIISFCAYFLFSEVLFSKTARSRLRGYDSVDSVHLAIIGVTFAFLLRLTPILLSGGFEVTWRGIQLEALLILLFFVVPSAFIVLNEVKKIGRLFKKDSLPPEMQRGPLLILVFPLLEPMLGNAFQVLAIGFFLYYLKKQRAHKFDLNELAYSPNKVSKSAATYLICLAPLGILLSTMLSLPVSEPPGSLRNENLVVFILTVLVFLPLLTISVSTTRSAPWFFWSTIGLDVALKILVLSVPLSLWLNESAAAKLAQVGVHSVFIVLLTTALQALFIYLVIIFDRVGNKYIEGISIRQDTKSFFSDNFKKIFLVDSAIYIMVGFVLAYIMMNVYSHLSGVIQTELRFLEVSNVRLRDFYREDSSASITEKIEAARGYIEGLREAMAPTLDEARTKIFITELSLYSLMFFISSALFFHNSKQYNATSLLSSLRSYTAPEAYRRIVRRTVTDKNTVIIVARCWYRFHFCFVFLVLIATATSIFLSSQKYREQRDLWEKIQVEERIEIVKEQLNDLETRQTQKH